MYDTIYIDLVGFGTWIDSAAACAWALAFWATKASFLACSSSSFFCIALTAPIFPAPPLPDPTLESGLLAVVENRCSFSTEVSSGPTLKLPVPPRPVECSCFGRSYNFSTLQNTRGGRGGTIWLTIVWGDSSPIPSNFFAYCRLPTPPRPTDCG